MGAWIRYQECGLTQEQSDRLKTAAESFVDSNLNVWPPRSMIDEWADKVADQVFPRPVGTSPSEVLNWLVKFGGWAAVFLTLFSYSFTHNVGLAIVWVVLSWGAVIALFKASEAADRKHDPHAVDRSFLWRDLSEVLMAMYEDRNRKKRIENEEYKRPLPSITPADVSKYQRAPIRWTPAGAQPAPMQTCTDREAEHVAKEWMEYLGEPRCRVTQATRDGGVDVSSEHFVAEVKYHAAPVPPNLVRQIFGAATAERKRAVFFALTGYTADAVVFAEKNRIPLFVYDYRMGTLHPKSSTAEQAIKGGLQSIL